MLLSSIGTTAAIIGYPADPKLQDFHITGQQQDKREEPQ